MGVGLTLVLLFLIVCVSVLFGIYMYLCSENEIRMFADPRYEERMRKLEKLVEELKEK